MIFLVGVVKYDLRMVPPLQNCRFCENCFWHDLKTNEVKYIKVYILENNFHKESI